MKEKVMRRTNEDKWQPPSPEMVSQLIESIGGIASACRLLRKNRNTIYRWLSGDSKIDYANYKMLRLLYESNKAP